VTIRTSHITRGRPPEQLGARGGEQEVRLDHLRGRGRRGDLRVPSSMTLPDPFW